MGLSSAMASSPTVRKSWPADFSMGAKKGRSEGRAERIWYCGGDGDGAVLGDVLVVVVVVVIVMVVSDARESTKIGSAWRWMSSKTFES